MQEKHVAQVTGTITLVQISNIDNNSLVITVTTLSDLETQTASKSLITTVTALSIALSSPAFQLALQTKVQSRSSRSTHTTQYRSASNSLLACPADKTPRRDSHS
ncbi:hypothetical protein AVEN_46876-1 [Araneus ventricosus]|uniref:Uncharacterized protein n=1 Tax=Araneus ventricosus TaxID=182803 RepID=A0A4Y2CN32_ARAVE|nr:hypothetical protein AVEN_46876-1 [Araneus ventricosus]